MDLVTQLTLFVTVVPVFGNGQQYLDKEYLFDNLTYKYNKNLRPNHNQSEPTKICVYFVFANLVYLAEVTGKLSVVGFFDVSWIDGHMAWDISDYGGISSILFPMDDVWTPSLLLMNPFDEKSSFLGLKQNKVRFTSDGHASWLPGQLISAACDIDVTFYPFDTQFCTLKYYIWDYNTDEIEATICNSQLSIENFTANGVWTLKNVSQTVEEKDYLQYILVTLTLQRDFGFFVINMISPIFLTGILNILVFKIHPNSGERIGYAITVLLAIAVFLSMLSDYLPNNSLPIPPLISFLLLSNLLMGTCIMLCTIMSLRIYNCDSPNISKLLKILVKCYVSFCCHEPKIKQKRRKIHASENIELNNSNTQLSDHVEEVPIVTWTDVGRLFDSVCFFVFFSWFISSHFGFAYALAIHYVSKVNDQNVF